MYLHLLVDLKIFIFSYNQFLPSPKIKNDKHFIFLIVELPILRANNIFINVEN